jgi:hypothetical protein
MKRGESERVYHGGAKRVTSFLNKHMKNRRATCEQVVHDRHLPGYTHLLPTYSGVYSYAPISFYTCVHAALESY